MKNLGTKIETFAKPIARGIDAIWGSDLANCSGCNKMRDDLDAGMPFTQAMSERFWSTKGQNMTFVIQLDVGEADNVEQALKQIAQGTIISVNPNPQIRNRGRHTVSIAVDAESLEAALQKKGEGTIMAVGRRPAGMQAPVPPVKQ